MGIKWQYEFEGFDLGEAGWYLPDFYLTDDRIYVEIKPALNLITDDDKLKISAMRKMLDDGWDTMDEDETTSETFPRYLVLLTETPDVPWQEGEGSKSVRELFYALGINWKKDSILVSEAVKAARQARF